MPSATAAMAAAQSVCLRFVIGMCIYWFLFGQGGDVYHAARSHDTKQENACRLSELAFVCLQVVVGFDGHFRLVNHLGIEVENAGEEIVHGSTFVWAEIVAF